MAIEIQETPLHEAKVRCSTEMKVLYFVDTLITQAVMDMANYQAENHERRHPGHSLEVLIYQAAPEKEEL